MTPQHTIKLILEGEAEAVEALAAVIREQYRVTWQSKDQHIPLTGHIRRHLRLEVSALGSGVTNPNP